MPKKEKLIIMGGSAAGPSAAARAKRVNPDLEVTIFEQGRFVSYGS
jgi:flavin-dependent dehydrogenase